ncbi:hypothetical protein Goarm_008482 [Gossypium armourianum]|uniref:SAGA-associated factor 11 n=1 Tax=Gossypium armourianum TaxID=34283 RepID=A0A7J9JQ15_9ROSI|nr:hypothetical protein [Gossypium armourianum]
MKRVLSLDESCLQLSLLIFGDLLDSIIVDVASESHRMAKLGLDPKLEEEEEESHPSVASVIFDCMNCGRSIAAGRFAPHSEKCMGKAIVILNILPYGSFFNII